MIINTVYDLCLHISNSADEEPEPNRIRIQNFGFFPCPSLLNIISVAERTDSTPLRRRYRYMPSAVTPRELVLSTDITHFSVENEPATL